MVLHLFFYGIGNPVVIVDNNGKEGVKYIDDNGRKTVESNIVILLQAQKAIPENVSLRRINRIERRNESIKKYNDSVIEQTRLLLDSVYNGEEGGSFNSAGEQVYFKFNIIGVESQNLAPDNSVISKMAVEYSIPAKRFNNNTIARAPIITKGSTKGALGLYSGNTISIAIGAPPITIAHEVGHSWGLPDYCYIGNTGGLMNTPAESYLTTKEVDEIWNKAIDRRQQ